MFRTIRLVGCLLAVIMSSMSSLSAFELEGTTLQPAAAVVSVGNSDGEVAASNGLIPDKWNCAKRAGEVRVRRVTLCWVLPESLTDAPVRTPGVIRYRILVEKGLDGLANGFAVRVNEILGLDTGWAGHGIRFAHVVREYDFTVLLAKPRSVDRLCRPLRTRGWLSCAIYRGAVINTKRWHEGAETWGSDVRGYHHYLINHEVGHVLGLRHLSCPEAGAPAPIMLQQTIFLKGCKANGVATADDLSQLKRIMPMMRRRFVSLRPPGYASAPSYRQGVRRSKRIRRNRYRSRRTARRQSRSRRQ